ncbi:phenylalanine--tRNA ligase subunit beta [Nitrososphaera sp.]|uniref:phenylalanine--tRNA ligase subunit beta n=1 Tax=Nitrososphaera sp. TaxID=1971748 RepID=UPI002EDA7C2B
MPVVNVTLERLKKLVPGVRVDKALEMLPFVGLDIESVDDGVVRVEYNPNRPDFSSDYGIARALAGLLGKKTGAPKFRIAGKSGISIRVDRRVKNIRPFVVALVAKNGRLDDEAIKQIIPMQEDLHNGPGRRRKKASIGIHNLNVVKPPVKYTVVAGSHSFAPLGSNEKMTVVQILQETQTGREYGHLLAKGKYPVIIDGRGTTLSFPPIINGEATKVDAKCRNLFVEVTATDKKAADDVLAVMAITLADAGFEIRSVTISNGSRRDTPEIKPAKMSVDARYVNETLGLELSPAQMIACLKKCRLDAKAAKSRITCTIPRYRTDISHSVDLAEEVAIGYGLYNIEPSFPASPSAGQRSTMSAHFDAARDTMAGLGMIEAFNFSLSSRQVQYELAGRTPEGVVLGVDGSKSAEHDVLRDSLVPSLLQSLAKNVHEEYPQKLFEIGKVFRKTGAIEESWRIAAVVAHGEAGYTEIKSAMQALVSAFGMQLTTKASQYPLFIRGRCAAVMHRDKRIGIIGEVTPLAIDSFRLRVPVAAFELDLSTLLG